MVDRALHSLPAVEGAMPIDPGFAGIANIERRSARST
jgi:hypothetical protein